MKKAGAEGEGRGAGPPVVETCRLLSFGGPRSPQPFPALRVVLKESYKVYMWNGSDVAISDGKPGRSFHVGQLIRLVLDGFHFLQQCWPKA